MHGVIKTKGFIKEELTPPPVFRDLILNENWERIDREVRELSLPGAPLFEKVSGFHPIKELEFIISLRKGGENEEGIWHDDGTRLIAFSWSLSLEPEKIAGGELHLRQKGQESETSLLTPAFGEMYIFATGQWGWEHKISEVRQGERLIIAGWGSI